jgi:hypothetical protein
MNRLTQSATAAWVIIAVGVLATLVGWFILRRPDRLALDAEAWTFCEQGYARARASVDSQMVDTQRPVISRVHATVALTCGAMRVTRRPAITTCRITSVGAVGATGIRLCAW